jgi:hypothetical protein
VPKPYSAASTSIPKRCANDANGRASLRHNEGPDGRYPRLMKTLPRVASEMALHVLAYNMTRVMSIMGIRPLMAAIRA